ncbi:MAG: hypothetical protein F6J95_013575 [Leptolyngbya sp. SIO1E4]|nr:hypothetical protein [Leptolyngbya sp. SIO1E4]
MGQFTPRSQLRQARAAALLPDPIFVAKEYFRESLVGHFDSVKNGMEGIGLETSGISLDGNC